MSDNNNINQKLNELIKNIEKNPASKNYINNLLNSQNANKIKAVLSDKDKENALNRFNSMSAEEIRQKLANVDTSKLAALNTDEIIKMIKKL